MSRIRAAARRRPLRQRLAVIAADPLDALDGAGGWVFDQSLAGWDVSVHVLDVGDPRPWRIMGSDVYDLRGSLDRRGHHPWPQALAISAALLDSHEQIRTEALAAIESGRCEMRVLGAAESIGTSNRLEPGRHRLSLAAQAFKRRAFAAAHMNSETVGGVEAFLGSSRIPFAAAAELVSLGN
ncbi:hypothetical protein VZC37_03905 [Gordonia sp. LSe1-13]|uniref:Uncharacterized protein n=1 Tax=Gordonia sesuvii TaxID=3116777 RepID=A0ABU7M8M4_9ACTN|nr:hypothetical protein [Gordonia sp. LSe1-13]